MYRRILFSAALVAFAADSAASQSFGGVASQPRAGRWLFDIGAQMGQPVGDFATQVDRAWGVGGSVRYHLPHATALGIRGDLAWLNYGNERKRVPLSPTINRVLVDMNTANDIVVIAAGPEVMIPRGPVRPYAFAVGGYSYFYTQSSVGDDNDEGQAFASSTNFSDGGLSASWGGGLRIPIALRSAEAALDAGARMTRNGTRSYLRRGDIVDQSDGSLLIMPRTTRADFWQYHIALSISPRLR
jgi:hypothetical protein